MAFYSRYSLARKKKRHLPQSTEEPLLCFMLVCFVSVRDVDWRKFDLIVERGPVSAYQKGPLMVLRPIFYGFLLGFGGSLMVALSILLITTRITQRNQHGYHRLVTSSSRSWRNGSKCFPLEEQLILLQSRSSFVLYFSDSWKSVRYHITAILSFTFFIPVVSGVAPPPTK